MKPTYTAPEILELGDAVVLTKGSYPPNPETFEHIDTKKTNLELDLETLDAE